MVSEQLLVTVVGALAHALLLLVIVTAYVVDNIVIMRPLLVIVVENHDLVVIPRAFYVRARTLVLSPASETVPIRSGRWAGTLGNALLPIRRYRMPILARLDSTADTSLESHSVVASRCSEAASSMGGREFPCRASAARRLAHLLLVLPLGALGAHMKVSSQSLAELAGRAMETVVDVVKNVIGANRTIVWLLAPSGIKHGRGAAGALLAQALTRRALVFTR